MLTFLMIQRKYMMHALGMMDLDQLVNEPTHDYGRTLYNPRWILLKMSMLTIMFVFQRSIDFC